MGLSDMFKSQQYKSELERLTAENNYLKSLMTPEMQHATNLKNMVDNLFAQKNYLQRTVAALNQEIAQKRQYVVFLDDETLYQSFGLYTPIYNLTNSELYKNRLEIVRQQQKQMIRNNTACSFPLNFTMNGNLAEGKRIIADNVKQILRSFNNECEAIIDKVKFNNVESIRKRIIKSFNDLNSLNAKMGISINPMYLDQKLQEMNLCYEYSMKKQEEKEEQQRIREEQREAQKVQKEIEEARKLNIKERSHYSNELHRIQLQLSSTFGTERELLLKKEKEYQQHIADIDIKNKDLDYREANQRAGYVYIISNIGSFGENIYKIGMTRRLEPMERVDELGDASVPFKFDVHALIFSNDAPALETALHRAFEDKKVNMVNQRREFFHVTLEEIKEVVRKNYDKTVEFTKIPPAEQYRESLIMRQNLQLSSR